MYFAIFYRLLNLILAHIFITLVLKIPVIFPKITTIWSQDYYVVDMDYVDESDVVMFTVKLTLRCT